MILRKLDLSSIFLTQNSEAGLAKIWDFQYAQIIGPEQMTTQILGDPRFRAPEVLQGKPYTFSADCFSLGVIIYFMCTQEFPFSNEQETLHEELDLDPLSCRGFTAQCLDLINKLLVKEPLVRFKASRCLAHSWFRE